jgi:hypothetical protein
MIASPKILCPECQHENEPERVYCHNCGARLDRSAVIPTKEPAKDTQKRVKKMFDPHRMRIRFLFFKTSKMILVAGLLAVVIQLLLPPDIPAPTKTEMLASQVRLDMENAVSRHQPPQVEFSEDQVNAYLASALRTKKTALNKPLLDFKRTIVAFGENMCTITVERSLYGYYSLYSSSAYSVSVADGKLVTSHKAGYLGRLPIHPQLMQYVDIIFSDVWAALDRDAKLVAKFGSIQFHDKHALLSVAATQ